MRSVIRSGLIAGIILFIASYGGLFLAIRFFPQFFVDYLSPVFNSGGGDRYFFFYSHPFVLALALSWFWERFKTLFEGVFVLRGLEFGLIYAVVALLPLLWITYGAWDVSFLMISTWWLYGLFQACVAGIVFAKLNP
ncbi:MAG: hypothetical protein K2Y12_04670 [Chitinophagaceae bacterium]|jgi:hypothetical protein|nr:hypothetical protein [Chitinophagales bacterium]MBX9891597.1 hypothetical protein [Chitinophagaceae bacterium]